MRVLVLCCLSLNLVFAVMDEMGCVGPAGGTPTVPATGPNLPELNWETRQPMPTARYGMAVAAGGSLLYAVGGYGGSRLTLNEMYDPRGDTWTAKTSMVNARNGTYGAALDGWVYVVGGYNGVSRLNIVEGYDVLADTWYTLPLLATQRTVPAAVGLNGKLYVFGGFDGTNYHRMVERYDPGTSTWDTVAPMPTGRCGLAAAALDGKIYVMGGWVGSNPTRTELEMYDPAGDSWVVLAPMPTGRMYLTAATLNGHILAIGGQLTFSGPQTGVVEAYNPATGEWTAENPMQVSRGSVGAAAIDGHVYAVGGWTGSSALADNERADDLSGIREERSKSRGDTSSLRTGVTSVNPNPFHLTTQIRFARVPGADGTMLIRDATGRLARALAVSAGQASVAWDRTDDAGQTVKPGVYFAALGRDRARLIVAR